ncbi:MAG TPA: hypothetical protein EYQ07_05350 [Candidatus Poseidoniales archaeon]|nr:MAG: hypothetical protein CXT64_00355 [Euryarchaeota archaeon]HIE81931.1 hypothetical protein [Candidatus Poseidoniales archaeon]HIL50312.1 hypothetical protein [Candidatus Poseidoniales archaeon]
MSENVEVELRWYQDSMAWLGLTIGPAIWLAMVMFLSMQIAWVSLACGGIIGFFLWLVALGYDNPRMAKATLWGIAINSVLAGYSAYLTFF